jgi:hypothetical protein
MAVTFTSAPTRRRLGQNGTDVILKGEDDMYLPQPGARQ